MSISSGRIVSSVSKIEYWLFILLALATSKENSSYLRGFFILSNLEGKIGS
ncbi:hypothetical protein ASZ90_004110 [hydrocarbon metagenome]|uniref:Uncharacterized protein n=1 Tax=hydrocarbon metagenome TaxID=938273 RepID=A0A0W8FYY7_9ZZZZ